MTSAITNISVKKNKIPMKITKIQEGREYLNEVFAINKVACKYDGCSFNG